MSGYVRRHSAAFTTPTNLTIYLMLRIALFLLILSRHKPLFVVPSLQSEIGHSVPSLQSGPFLHPHSTSKPEGLESE
jgi:hypothetical protein